MLALLIGACDMGTALPTATPVAVVPPPPSTPVPSPSPVTLAITPAPTATDEPIGTTPTAISAANATPTAAGVTMQPNLSASGTGWLRTGLDGTMLEAIVTAADGQVFYAAGANGIWRSTDFGLTWTQTTASFPAASITVDPADAQKLFAAQPPNCKEPISLHQSTDGGATWREAGDNMGAPVFLSAGRLVAASCTGTQLSDDGGSTWRNADQTAASSDVLGYAIGTDGDQVVYAAYYLLDSSISIRRSADNGETWTVVAAPTNATRAPISGNGSLALQSDPETLYLATMGGVLQTTDLGANWQSAGEKLSSQPTTLLRFLSASGDRQAIYAAIDGKGVLRNSGGPIWSTVATDMGVPTIASLAYVASTFAGDVLTPPILLSATADGVWRVSLASAR